LFAGKIEAAPGAAQRGQRFERGLWRATGRDRKARGNERVLDLEGARQWQAEPVRVARASEPQQLGEALEGNIEEADALAGGTDREQAQPSLLRRRDHGVGVLVINIYHSSAARLNELAEQPQLGGEIGFKRGMIVEVVATDIGEGAGRDPHAVE